MLAGGLASVPTTTASAATPDCATNAAVKKASYAVKNLDGTTFTTDQLSGQLQAGDVVTGTFTLHDACVGKTQLSGASYWAPSATWSLENQRQQVLFDSTTVNKATKTVRLTLRIPGTAPVYNPDTCPNPHLKSPKSENGNGSAGPGNPYASTCDGRASQNGSGNGKATGRPCQGCVGNADNKNPPGQAPNGSDRNAGYECDRNNGVGKGNPAHSGCAVMPNFQMEFVVGPVIRSFFVGGKDVAYPQSAFIAGGSTLG